MPKEEIEQALRRAADSSTKEFRSHIYEVVGHAGVGLLVCTFSDNSDRTSVVIDQLVSKSEGKMASGGSVLLQFEQKVCV